MNRGSVVIAGERSAFAGKPRPWLVLQNGLFLDQPSTVTVCMISATAAPAVFRIPAAPDAENGLAEMSRICIDKIVTLRLSSIAEIAGQVNAETLNRVDDALRLWLDL